MSSALNLTDGLIHCIELLIVESPRNNDERVTEYLANDVTQDWRLHQAHSLSEALELLEQMSFEAILLELDLPDSQGLETLLAVLQKYPDTPVIASMERDDPDLGMQAVHYGAQDYLVRQTYEPALLKRTLLHSIERQKLVNSFHHASLHDPLTNLANRNLFLTLLQQAIERRNRNPEQLFAAVFLDLDNFKYINDSHGHLTGDQTLSEIALRLKASVRASDVVSRLAGDEFGLLIEDLQEPLDVLPVVHRLAQVIAQPIRIHGVEFTLSASLGVALSDRACHTAVELLENADMAMYQAKLNGKATYCIYTEHMDHEKQVLNQLEASFKTDLGQSGLLRLRYRPVVSVQDGHFYGLETDIQCQSSGWQNVPFDELLRMAGGSRMLDSVNAWILQEVRTQLQSWDHKQAQDWKIFLHLAPEQLKAPGLAKQLQEILLAGDLPAERFYLSLKESIFQKAFNQDLLPLLKQLHKQGFKLYLEDFGGSYTILNTLSQIPVDMVKINLDELSALLPSHAASDRFLVLAPVIQLAHNLGMQVAVDGIRSDEEVARLQSLEAVFAQGSFFSPPLSGKEAEAWL